MGWMEQLAAWWVDYLAMATMLLVVVLAAGLAMRQPVQRMTTAWAGMIALVVLAVCCAMPGWPRWAVHNRLPIAGQPTVTHSAVRNADARFKTVREYLAHRDQKPTANDSMAGRGNLEKQPTDSIANKNKPDTNHNAPASARFDYWLLATVSLLVGSMLVAAWLVLGHVRAWRLCRAATPASEFAVAELRSLVGTERRLPRLLVHEKLSSAGAVGLWQPTILLSRHALESQEPSAASALRAILAHEWAHIERGDLWLLALGRLLLILLYLHPLYWLLRRRILADQELLADAAAANCCGRHRYAETLVAWARQRPRGGARPNWGLGIWERPSQLSKRIAVLLNEQRVLRTTCSRGWQLVCGSAALALIVGLSLLTLNPARIAVAETTPPKPIAKAPAVESPAKADAQTVVVAGSCLDDHRKPIANARVRMFRIDHSDKYFMKVRGRMQVTFTGGLSAPNDKGQLTSSSADDPDKQRLVHETQTDSNGQFQFPAVEATESWLSRTDNVWIVAQSPNKATELLPANLTRAADGKQSVEPIAFKLQPGVSLRGRITNAEGQPVAGAVVTPSEFNDLAKPIPGILCAVSDADGRYEINDMEETDVDDFPPTAMQVGTIRLASFVLSVNHTDYAPGIIEYTKTPDTLDLVLQRPATLSGRVLFDENGQPAKSARVRWTHENGTSDSALDTDAQGNYSLTNLQAGNYTINAHRDDRLDAFQKVLLTPGKNQLDLRLKQGGFIKGRVVDDATGKTPQFSSTDGVGPGQAIGLLESRKIASDTSQNCIGYLNTDGTFSMAVEPGHNLIHYFNPGFQLKDAERWSKEGVHVAVGKTTEIELRVVPRAGGWNAMIAEARATEAEAKGESAPPAAPAEPAEKTASPLSAH